MGELITVEGWEYTKSNQVPEQSPPNVALDFAITATPQLSSNTRGAGNAVVIEKIDLSCTCSGAYGPSLTFQGEGSATLLPGSQKVRVNGQPIVLIGDQVTITCSGTVTNTVTSATTTGVASITVTVSNTNQTKIRAS